MISATGVLFLALAAGAPAAEPGARAPAAAGRFYPADASELSELVDRHFAQAGGARLDGRVVAVIAPHAGLAYSGRLAAAALAAAEGLDPEVVVILGTGHKKPLDGAALHPGGYSVPGVTLRYDAALAKDLLRRTRSIVADAGAHKKEHSIEVVLPYVARVAPNARVVALVMNTQSLEPAREIGRALAAALEGRRALIVVSSDLSHYPPAETAALVDGATLEALESLDPVFFWLTNRLLLTRGIKTLAVAWCGEGAVTAAVEAARRLGARSARVLDAGHSGQTIGDDSRVVGYAAVAFTTAEPPARARDDSAVLAQLARDAIAQYLRTKKLPIPALSRSPRLNVPAAVFVALRDRSGRLRGAMGTLKREAPMHEAVARAAVDAAVADARFKPVTLAELENLKIEVAVLRAGRPSPEAERQAKEGVFPDESWRTF